MQDLLEPQLVGLVHDHEQHLVVGGLALLRALERLAAEQPLELEVFGVLDGLPGLAHGAALLLSLDSASTAASSSRALS